VGAVKQRSIRNRFHSTGQRANREANQRTDRDSLAFGNPPAQIRWRHLAARLSVTNGTAAALAAALRDRYVLDRELGRGGMATVYLDRTRRLSTTTRFSRT
jgi:hypothetical protein